MFQPTSGSKCEASDLCSLTLIIEFQRKCQCLYSSYEEVYKMENTCCVFICSNPLAMEVTGEFIWKSAIWRENCSTCISDKGTEEKKSWFLAEHNQHTKLLQRKKRKEKESPLIHSAFLFFTSFLHFFFLWESWVNSQEFELWLKI